jgi:hypothetical protein
LNAGGTQTELRCICQQRHQTLGGWMGLLEQRCHEFYDDINNKNSNSL